MKTYVEQEINSPIDKVWAAITDIEHSDHMISGILKIEVVNKPVDSLVGFKWKETRKIFGKEAMETMWITDCVPLDHYWTRAENHGAIYKTKMAVKEQNGKTLLSMEFSGSATTAFGRFMSKVMGFFMKNSMQKMCAADLEDIKNFVEKT
ncbi:SRPBCC family protein [Reinekea forsetii]|nr:SRPBCC family protein [Reinekea forsetii]